MEKLTDGRPVAFAIDEFHRLNDFGDFGTVFHSDFQSKKYTPDNLVRKWQDYEREKRTFDPTSPYKSPTTSFSKFYYIMEEFLKTHNHKFVFTSTRFSSWKTLPDPSKYSREHPEINLFYDLHLINTEEMKIVLKKMNDKFDDDKNFQVLKIGKEEKDYFLIFLFHNIQNLKI